MSRWKLIRLKFGRNVTHFGELGIGLEETSERVRSDTLFSAWISAYARLFLSAEVKDLIEKLPRMNEKGELINTTPLFRLSSTFIWQQINYDVADETVYYLPSPLKYPRNYPAGEDDLEFAKTFKKLKYLPLSVWQRWYQGQGFTNNDRDELIAKAKGISTGQLTKAGTFDYAQAFQMQKLPKVAIDRTTRATNFYHTGVVSYCWELVNGRVESRSGLYFLVEFPTEDTQFDQTFLTVLDFLGSEGLGGERSSGAGQFETEVVDLDKTWTAVIQFSTDQTVDKTPHSLISLFWQSQITPTILHQASYELQERGGWVTSLASDGQQRRQAITMLAEGSVLQTRPAGVLADVTPRNFRTHRVYRSGISLSLPIAV
jgi:CRISPR-associated protein Csm4